MKYAHFAIGIDGDDDPDTPSLGRSMIILDKLRPELVAAASQAYRPGVNPEVQRDLTLMAFLNALLADDEAMERGWAATKDSLIPLFNHEDKMRAAIIAAVTLDKTTDLGAMQTVDGLGA